MKSSDIAVVEESDDHHRDASDSMVEQQAYAEHPLAQSQPEAQVPEIFSAAEREEGGDNDGNQPLPD